MRYILKLSEEQAEIIKIALEEYFRLRMNQTWDFADDICFEGFDYKNYTEEDFSDRIERRNFLRDELEKLLNVAHPLRIRGKFREKTIEMRRAQDIWQVIRSKLWDEKHSNKDDWRLGIRVPISTANEPLPKIYSEVED